MVNIIYNYIVMVNYGIPRTKMGSDSPIMTERHPKGLYLFKI
jgi:hypothetical protein